MKRTLATCCLALGLSSNAAVAQTCPIGPATVQVLGSGGPAINRERASTSYLLWMDGKARMLVDMGGGAFLRFGQAEAKLADLSLIALSHFHPDHVSDLPALMWLSTFTRKAPLAISGPSGNELVPDLNTFLTRQFDAKDGVYQVLGTSLGAAPAPGVGVPGVGGGIRLLPTTIDVRKTEASPVFEQAGMKVTALGIPHGNIPALAYRVQAGNASVVFSSDQNGTNPAFVEFARGADVLVMHLAIAAGTTNAIHAAPAKVGSIAQEAKVGRLILSHIGQFDLNAAVAEVKSTWTGPLIVGADLQCTAVK